ncbi:MAG: Transcription elongation factor NusA [Candidatus Giovannonibacteria bacterium GW2011_GWC2_43_8]|nr:MAG: Transcription elongation factor NusA [Candidatus Giovannonibacteria bacterium GW2011_GWC2_43_8]
MLDIKNFNAALDQLASEKGISKEKILETIDMALAAAYKRDYGKKTQLIRAKFDIATGKAEFWQVKLVVDESMIKSEEEISGEPATIRRFGRGNRKMDCKRGGSGSFGRRKRNRRGWRN